MVGGPAIGEDVDDFEAHTEPYKRAMGVYLDLMAEIKRRGDFIADILDENKWPFDVRSAEEFCFCNLRMICELIALGCLLAHGDNIEGARASKLLNTYRADAIIRTMTRLHPSFYPRPVRQVDDLHSAANAGVGPFLTKEELLQLYWKCGGLLHVGGLTSLPTVMARLPDFGEVQSWHQKVLRLLTQHKIDLLDPRIELVVTMASADPKAKGGPIAQISLRQEHSKPPA